MHVISKKALADFWSTYHQAKIPMQSWYKTICESSFKNFNDIRKTFNSVDYVAPYTVFDIGGNNYRIITAIHYNRQKMFIRFVFTHRDYEYWNKHYRKVKK